MNQYLDVKTIFSQKIIIFHFKFVVILINLLFCIYFTIICCNKQRRRKKNLSSNWLHVLCVVEVSVWIKWFGCILSIYADPPTPPPLLASGCSSCRGRTGTVWPGPCCCLVWTSRCVCWPDLGARRGCWWSRPERARGTRCSGAVGGRNPVSSRTGNGMLRQSCNFFTQCSTKRVLLGNDNDGVGGWFMVCFTN